MTLSILQRIADGESVAVAECINHYGAMVWSLARRLSRTKEDAEDATQEIFLDIWRSAGRYDGSLGSERLFVAVISRRRLIDRLRKVALEPPMDSTDLAEISVAVDSFAVSDVSLDIDDATRVLAELRPEQRQVLLLSLVQGLSHSEIAAQLTMPLGTVKTLIRRGLLRARDLINRPTTALSPSGPLNSLRYSTRAASHLRKAMDIPSVAVELPVA